MGAIRQSKYYRYIAAGSSSSYAIAYPINITMDNIVVDPSKIFINVLTLSHGNIDNITVSDNIVTLYSRSASMCWYIYIQVIEFY